MAASVVDPLAFLRELRSKPKETEALVAHVTDFLIAWSRQLIAAGANAITIHEDTTTPALVGPKTFETAVFPHLKRLTAAIKEEGARVLLHMCGALGKSAAAVAQLNLDAYIPDASLSPAEVRQSLPGVAVVGNISTFLLHQGRARRLSPNSPSASFAKAASMCSRRPAACRAPRRLRTSWR